MTFIPYFHTPHILGLHFKLFSYFSFHVKIKNMTDLTWTFFVRFLSASQISTHTVFCGFCSTEPILKVYVEFFQRYGFKSVSVIKHQFIGISHIGKRKPISNIATKKHICLELINDHQQMHFLVCIVIFLYFSYFCHHNVMYVCLMV